MGQKMYQIKGFLQKEFHYTDYQYEQIKYVFLSFASEASKMLLLFLFFLFFSKIPELIVATVVLLSVRIFTGGLHMKHYFSCFFVSFLIFFLGIFVLPNLITISTLGMIFILNICIVLVYICGPILSVYRPPITSEQKKSNSIKAATSILIYMYIIFVLPSNGCLYVGFWMIVLQTLQLGLAKILIKRKE